MQYHINLKKILYRMNVYNFTIITVLWDSYMSTKQCSITTQKTIFIVSAVRMSAGILKPNKWMKSNEGPTFKSPRSRLALGGHPSPIKWVLGAQCTWYIADHSPPPSVKVKYVWSYNSTLPYAFRLQSLMKHRNNFILCCYSPDANTAFKENYYRRIAIWTRMFRNNDSMHVLVNKLNPPHKQITNKEESYQAVGRERINFQTFC